MGDINMNPSTQSQSFPPTSSSFSSFCSLNTINDDPSQTIGMDLFDSLSDNLFGPSLPSSFDPWLVDPFVVRSLAQSECHQNKLSRSQNCPQNTWYGKDRC
jgi:hypothetical protein